MSPEDAQRISAGVSVDLQSEDEVLIHQVIGLAAGSYF